MLSVPTHRSKPILIDRHALIGCSNSVFTLTQKRQWPTPRILVRPLTQLHNTCRSK
jgi:hypothetical protein